MGASRTLEKGALGASAGARIKVRRRGTSGHQGSEGPHRSPRERTHTADQGQNSSGLRSGVPGTWEQNT